MISDDLEPIEFATVQIAEESILQRENEVQEANVLH